MRRKIEQLNNGKWKTQGASHSGTAITDFGESWIVFALFPKSKWRDAMNFLRELGGECYRGPGRVFCRKPWLRRSKGHILITQSFGLDV